MRRLRLWLVFSRYEIMLRMSSAGQGYAVEDYARRLAGALGVPDFVYEPTRRKKGTSGREVSDGLLVAGTNGLIVQTKNRGETESAADSPEKAASWCKKNGLKAQRQARGTRRSLLDGDVSVRSLRGFERLMPDATDWPNVVIINHPGAPVVSFPASSDTLFMSLADWLNLHWMVRSTAGVITYVQRALESGISVPLGREADRYKQLATADLEACDTLTTFPVLSPVVLDEREELHADLVDDLVEKVADSSNTGFHSEHYLKIVEQLDRIPLIGRARLGAKLKRTFQEVSEAKSRRSFMVTDRGIGGVLGGNRLVFLCDFHDFQVYGYSRSRFEMDVGCYAMLRQQQALEAGADSASATLAVGVLHHPQLGERYQFAWVPGTPPQMPSEIRAYWEGIFGNIDIRA